MKLTICDLDAGLILHAAHFIARDDLKTVSAVVGNITAQVADAAVSPANSFGLMDGGVDLAYSRKWGWHVQEQLRASIRARPMGELLVGEALVVATGDPDLPFCISAPTMRVPRPIHDPADVYLASRAAFLAAREHGFAHIVMPGMGTLTGRVPHAVATRFMLDAYRAVFG